MIQIFLKTTEFEFSTFQPEIDQDNAYIVESYDEAGNCISTTKNFTSMYVYTYTLTLHEERYNILEFKNGSVGLKYTR